MTVRDSPRRRPAWALVAQKLRAQILMEEEFEDEAVGQQVTPSMTSWVDFWCTFLDDVDVPEEDRGPAIKELSGIRDQTRNRNYKRRIQQSIQKLG